MAAPAPARTRRAAAPARRTTPARIPPADRRRGAPAPEVEPRRPNLRVVSDARLVAARRRRRLRGLVILTGIVMMASLFSLAAFHAMLAKSQADLDTIEERVSDAQARYESLRLDVAELEAPERIVREAQERLGMVPPPGVTYLTPSEAATQEVGEAAAASASTADQDGERTAWASIKPYLSGRP